uniref:MGC85180 protein n=1 Tax=Xenopus laevis TaxID=8355 RepID=Q5HZ80_XENLA|nr:MGC85180 protein [Xenopus laevis]
MEYLLQVKLGCLFGLLFLTLLFGLVPSRVKCFREGLEREAHQRWISFISCLAGGVFLAACLLDILPDFLRDIKQEMINRQIITDFPLPEFILGTGFLMVLIVERIVLDCSEVMSEETTPLLSGNANSPARQEQPRGHSHSGQHNDIENPRHHFHVDFHAHSSFRSFVLIISLSLHSIFEGIAIGLQNVQSEVLQIAVAILVHKSIIAVSLSLLLLQSSVQTRWFVLSIVMFALMSPLGIGIGIGVMHKSDENRMVQCVLEGLAAGTFVYITFLEILPHELNSNKWRLPKVIFILLGFSGMAALRFLG